LSFISPSLFGDACRLFGGRRFRLRERWIASLLVALLPGFMLPWAASGAERVKLAATTPRALSLAEAKRIAFQRNWDLLASKSNVDLAVAQKIVSHEFPNPTFSFAPTQINTDVNPSSTAAGNSILDRDYNTTIAVSQLFEIGKRSVRQASAAAGLQAAEASFMDARRTLDLAVSKAYIAALLAQANVRIIHQTMESLLHEAKIAETRLNAGDISRSDKAQIEIAAARSELDAEAALSTAKTARIALEVLLGSKEARGDWAPTDSIEKLVSENMATGPAETRPDLLAARASLRKAVQDRKLQEAMRIPDPTLQVEYERQPPSQPNTVGFGISLPLPIWNQHGGNIRAALAAQNAAESQVGKVETQIASDISVAETAYQEAVTRWRRYENNIQPRSAEVLKTISYAYKKGGASLLDLLSAERDDNAIRLVTAQSMADSATAAATLLNVKNISTSPAPAKDQTAKRIHAPSHR
jgi:cobalt-zinc-cadmium efflux system outer membrane protein